GWHQASVCSIPGAGRALSLIVEAMLMLSSPSADVSWSCVLESLEAAVSQAVEDASERARRLQETTQATHSGQKPVDWELRLAQLHERCQTLAGMAAGAAAKIAEVEAVLAQGEEGLKRWIRDTERARERLANWVGRAVG